MFFILLFLAVCLAEHFLFNQFCAGDQLRKIEEEQLRERQQADGAWLNDDDNMDYVSASDGKIFFDARSLRKKFFPKIVLKRKLS